MHSVADVWLQGPVTKPMEPMCIPLLRPETELRLFVEVHVLDTNHSFLVSL
jgi:hypothetical protein